MTKKRKTLKQKLKRQLRQAPRAHLDIYHDPWICRTIVWADIGGLRCKRILSDESRHVASAEDPTRDLVAAVGAQLGRDVLLRLYDRKYPAKPGGIIYFNGKEIGRGTLRQTPEICDLCHRTAKDCRCLEGLKALFGQ